ncbi:unnamed protein product [Spirodela intermedia]|uniref:Mannosyltransferase n=1 Tax=Spirodela intermedia TaxID=51605 RepID=A0A7I8J7A6_SPIIN|nr:unnamed protein product [Spirodela intermedia]CAA6665615.1 unnamed protein product [Spirodela intermedia]
MALGVLRYMSATSNIIHDCDEVFNYWEPLHYLLYKSGFQTWEYSSAFALRSYLYIFFHALVAEPVSWLFSDEKVQTVPWPNLIVTETALVVALSKKYGNRLACYTLAMLCLTSGCFFASTSFLPSSFSMYSVTLSSALFLLGRHAMAVSVAAAGVIVGWPFSVLVVLPLTIYSLTKGNFKLVFLSGTITSILILMDIVCCQSIGLQRFRGGESHLYGTEGPLFYFKNGFNNFNFCFILALLFLAILPIARKKYAPDLLVVVAPNLNLLSICRFLYPIYPLICIAAAAVIESIPDLFRDKYAIEDSIIVKVAKAIRPIVLSVILCASHSRTFSLLHGYSAPLAIYKHLEHHDDAGVGSVLCVGSEWHRYPSSFFVPSYISQVRWIDDGFRGLLPFPFNSTLGGTASSPPHFNSKNTASDQQYLKDLDVCTFLVELDLRRPYPSRGSDLSQWETLAAIHFLDRELSPAVYRSFFIPHLWHKENAFGLYRLLRRVPARSGPS